MSVIRLVGVRCIAEQAAVWEGRGHLVAGQQQLADSLGRACEACFKAAVREAALLEKIG